MLGNFSECDYESNKHIINIAVTVTVLAGVHEARSDKPLRFQGFI